MQQGPFALRECHYLGAQLRAGYPQLTLRPTQICCATLQHDLQPSYQIKINKVFQNGAATYQFRDDQQKPILDLRIQLEGCIPHIHDIIAVEGIPWSHRSRELAEKGNKSEAEIISDRGG